MADAHTECGNDFDSTRRTHHLLLCKAHIIICEYICTQHSLIVINTYRPSCQDGLTATNHHPDHLLIRAVPVPEQQKHSPSALGIRPCAVGA